MVNRRFYHKIIIVILIFNIFTSSCFASSTSNMIDGMKNLSTVDEIYNYIKTTFGSDGSNVTNSFLNGILQTLKKRLSTVHDIVWIDFGTRNSMGAVGDLGDYMYRDSNTQASIYSKLNEFYNRYYTYSDGNAALLNQINNNTTNMYGSQSATNVHLSALRNEINNFDWEELTYNPNYYDGNRNQITPSNWSSLPNPTLVSFNYTTPGTYIYCLKLPISYSYSLTDFKVEILFNQYSQVYKPIMSYVNVNMLSVEYYFIASLQQANGIFFRVSSPTGLQFTQGAATLKRIDSSKKDYFTILKIMQNNNMLENQSDIVEAINNKQLEANVDVSINNTINDNDLTLDVDLPNNATNDTSSLLNKLKQLMLTGVATNQLLNALDDVELHTWYSQSNKNVVEALNNQYTSLYD